MVVTNLVFHALKVSHFFSFQGLLSDDLASPFFHRHLATYQDSFTTLIRLASNLQLPAASSTSSSASPFVAAFSQPSSPTTLSSSTCLSPSPTTSSSTSPSLSLLESFLLQHLYTLSWLSFCNQCLHYTRQNPCLLMSVVLPDLVHRIESVSTIDNIGKRFVVFLVYDGQY